MFFVIFWTALVRYTWLSNSSRFFFPTISTFGCFWSQWPTSLAVTMRCGRLPSRSDVNMGWLTISSNVIRLGVSEHGDRPVNFLEYPIFRPRLFKKLSSFQTAKVDWFYWLETLSYDLWYSPFLIFIIFCCFMALLGFFHGFTGNKPFMRIPRLWVYDILHSTNHLYRSQVRGIRDCSTDVWPVEEM